MLNIDSIRKYFPFNIRDKGIFWEYMVKEYLQCTLLQIISTSKYATGLTITGGTSLRLFHDTQRFSEDIDFDTAYSLNEIKELMDYLGFNMDKLNYNVSFKPKSEGSYTWNMFIDGSVLDKKQKIRFDFLDYDAEYEKVSKYLNRLGATCLVNIPNDSTLLSMKIHAFLKRHVIKLRDAYDIVHLSGYVLPDFDYLKKKKLAYNNEDVKDVLIKRFDKIDITRQAMSFKPLLFNPDDFEMVKNFKQIIKDWRI